MRSPQPNRFGVLQRRGANRLALSAGRDPQAEASSRLGPLLADTVAAEHLDTEAPRSVDAIHADRVIAIDCTVDEAEPWVAHTSRGVVFHS